MLTNIIKNLDMGGYGIYVWPCYFLLLLVITWNVFSAFRRHLMLRKALKKDIWHGTAE